VKNVVLLEPLTTGPYRLKPLGTIRLALHPPFPETLLADGVAPENPTMTLLRDEFLEEGVERNSLQGSRRATSVDVVELEEAIREEFPLYEAQINASPGSLLVSPLNNPTVEGVKHDEIKRLHVVMGRPNRTLGLVELLSESLKREEAEFRDTLGKLDPDSKTKEGLYSPLPRVSIVAIGDNVLHPSLGEEEGSSILGECSLLENLRVDLHAFEPEVVHPSSNILDLHVRRRDASNFLKLPTNVDGPKVPFVDQMTLETSLEELNSAF
jgi:hypothetical protein